MKVVADVEAHAHQRVNKAFASMLESEAKTQPLINATEMTCKRKIFLRHLAKQRRRLTS
jgi:hypothetical protein